AAFFPSVRKFDDSTRGHMNDYSDRPYILFRFAECYLICAEAAIKGGATTADAAAMINVLRTRAALKDRQTPAEYAAAAGVQPFNMLRPIPQSQIDLVTEGPPYPQNPGYF